MNTCQTCGGLNPKFRLHIIPRVEFHLLVRLEKPIPMKCIFARVDDNLFCLSLGKNFSVTMSAFARERLLTQQRIMYDANTAKPINSSMYEWTPNPILGLQLALQALEGSKTIPNGSIQFKAPTHLNVLSYTDQEATADFAQKRNSQFRKILHLVGKKSERSPFTKKSKESQENPE